MGIRDSLHARFHEARADLFVRLLKPHPGATLLDVGGSDGALAARITVRVPMEVTVADVSADHREAVIRRGFSHCHVPEDGGLPFEDGAFDFVLANSVIEHVTLPKEECRVTQRVPQAEWTRRSREAQKSFAREIVRVGGRYFVQTPHKHFPIDQHIHLPLVHYLSHNGACRVVSLTDRFWVKHCQGTVDWELLTVPDMAELFPDADIHVERFLGLPKSIVAWRGAEG